jgi:hypothetical protein
MDTQRGKVDMPVFAIAAGITGPSWRRVLFKDEVATVVGWAGASSCASSTRSTAG